MFNLLSPSSSLLTHHSLLIYNLKPQTSNVFFPGKGGYLHLVPEYEAKTPPALAGSGHPGNGL